jgi:hypothetical protein
MKYTDYEIEQMEALVRELLSINEELNARCIAFSAKLENEEKKVQKLQQQLLFISQAFTNKTYEA